MSWHEAPGKFNDWMTPKYLFDAMGVIFDVDVAAPKAGGFVPAKGRITEASLQAEWRGFVWMNPPFGGRNGIAVWLEKFFEHGDGIALTPDRTSAPWWQRHAPKADCILFVGPKVKFILPSGLSGNSPSTGTCLMASGRKGMAALERANGKIGVLLR